MFTRTILDNREWPKWLELNLRCLFVDLSKSIWIFSAAVRHEIEQVIRNTSDPTAQPPLVVQPVHCNLARKRFFLILANQDLIFNDVE